MKRVALFLLLLASLSVHAQVINTVAGTGVWGYSGDHGPATAAKIQAPACVAVDYAGNMYITDVNNVRVRKVSVTGIITTFAGTGVAGYSGDEGPATAAQIGLPSCIIVDPWTGSVIFADRSKHVIRKVTPDGIIHTIAGIGGTSGFSGDGTLAVFAMLASPEGLAFDKHRNLYICDWGNQRVRRIDTAGIIHPFAGIGSIGFSGDNGPAVNAQFFNPVSIIADTLDNIYVSDFSNHAIRKINTSGTITTIAGTGGTSGISGDGGPATAALLYFPRGLAFDAYGSLFIGDRSDNRLRRIDPSGVMHPFAGTGSGVGPIGDGGPATAAAIYYPYGITFDRFGSLYEADEMNSRIRKIFDTGWNKLTVLCGNAHILPICMNDSVKVDTFLTVNEMSLGKTITWSILTPPLHGTISIADTAISTGAFLSPSGSVYVANTGYIGADTFKVLVTNQSKRDTIVFYVDVNVTPVVSAINGADTVCPGLVTTLSDLTIGGTWASSNGAIATVGATSGMVLGLAPGTATISYNVVNQCGSGTATKTITVFAHPGCPTGVTGIIKPQSGIWLAPNPVGDQLEIHAVEKISTIEVIDVTGKYLLGGNYNDESIILNVGHLHPGLYYLRANHTTVLKFVKL